MHSSDIPALSSDDARALLDHAAASTRRRHPKILHAPGDEFNRVFNGMMHDSYMQPHHHPGPEKIERIYLIEGRIVVLFFDERGAIQRTVLLERGGVDMVEVPAFAWHTYVILSDHAITYETMMGRYEPATWKEMAAWAPTESDGSSAEYLATLKRQAVR